MSVEPQDPLWLALSHLPGTLWLLPVLCVDLIMAPLLFPGSTAMPATPSLTMTSRPRRSCSSVMVGTSNSAVHLDWECTLTCSLVNSYSSFKTQVPLHPLQEALAAVLRWDSLPPPLDGLCISTHGLLYSERQAIIIVSISISLTTLNSLRSEGFVPYTFMAFVWLTSWHIVH